MCSICGLNVKGRLWIQVAGIRYYHIITLYIQTYRHTCRHADMLISSHTDIQTYIYIYISLQIHLQNMWLYLVIYVFLCAYIRSHTYMTLRYITHNHAHNIYIRIPRVVSRSRCRSKRTAFAPWCGNGVWTYHHYKPLLLGFSWIFHYKPST